MRHAEIEELLGAYALDAVEPEEADLLEAHLPTCPRCRAEVSDFRETAAMLAHGGAKAPDGIWDRIAGTLEEAPPRLELARVVPLRTPIHRVGVGLVAGIVSVAAAVISVMGIKVVEQDNRIADLAASMRGGGLEREIAALALDRDSVKVHLVSPDGARSADAIMGPDGRGFLVKHNLPALSESRTYQLWAQVGDKKVSLGVLGPEPGTVPFQVKAPQLSALAITAETANGVAQPSPENPAVVSGWIPGKKVSA